MRRRLRTTVMLLIVAVAGLLTAAPSPAGADEGDGTFILVTVPSVPGARFDFDGQRITTDAEGKATLATTTLGNINERLFFVDSPSGQFTFQRLAGLRTSSDSGEVAAVFSMSAVVDLSFVNLQGETVAPADIESLKLKSSIGVEYVYEGTELEQPVELPALRVVPGPQGLETKQIYYTVQELIISGTNTVNRSQQKFFPDEITELAIETQFYQVSVASHDALFSFDTGDAVLVRWPDGSETRHPIADGRAELPLLPRGEYEMRIDGSGLVTWRPVSVSRDQELELELMSVFDITVVMVTLLLLAVAALVVGRRRMRVGATDGISTDGISTDGISTDGKAPPRPGEEVIDLREPDGDRDLAVLGAGAERPGRREER